MFFVNLFHQMKILIFIAVVVIGVVSSQRPFYASGILPQNKENSTNQQVDNRDPKLLPPGAGGQWSYVDLISTWPRKSHPLWYTAWNPDAATKALIKGENLPGVKNFDPYPQAAPKPKKINRTTFKIL